MYRKKNSTPIMTANLGLWKKYRLLEMYNFMYNTDFPFLKISMFAVPLVKKNEKHIQNRVVKFLI